MNIKFIFHKWNKRFWSLLHGRVNAYAANCPHTHRFGSLLNELLNMRIHFLSYKNILHNTKLYTHRQTCAHSHTFWQAVCAPYDYPTRHEMSENQLTACPFAIPFFFVSILLFVSWTTNNIAFFSAVVVIKTKVNALYWLLDVCIIANDFSFISTSACCVFIQFCFTIYLINLLCFFRSFIRCVHELFYCTRLHLFFNFQAKEKMVKYCSVDASVISFINIQCWL